MSNPHPSTLPVLSALSLSPAADGRGDLRGTVESIYQTFHPELLRYLLLSGCDETDAREYLQEGFLRLVRHLQQGKSIDAPKHWLLRVLHNIRCDDYHRSSGYVAIDESDLESLLHQRSDAFPDPDPEAEALARERYARVRAAMATLTDRQYQCVLLRAHGLKLREIADLFGISVVTVAEACGRATEKLGRLIHE